MKVAVASENANVSAHFGHCHEFSIFIIEDGKCTKCDAILNPGHEPGVLPPFLARQGVNCIIAGGIGSRAINLFKENGIEVLVGATGKVSDVIDQFCKGTLKTAESTCTHVD